VTRVDRQYELLAAGRYPGGKNGAGTWQRIIGLFPTHWNYAEPFVGSGAIFRRKPSAASSFLIDLDPQVAEHWRRLAPPGAIVIHGDGIQWLEALAGVFTSDWLIYLDPPYPRSSRGRDRIYRYELAEAQHRRLLDLAASIAASVVVSSYWSPLYGAKLKDWWHDSFEAVTRWGGPKTEHVWCNFNPLEAPSPDSPYVGANFRERERVRRKVRRHVERFMTLPAFERRAILAALVEAHSHTDPPSPELAIVPAASPEPAMAAATARNGDAVPPRQKRRGSSRVKNGEAGHPRRKRR
jgi:DNA adenine methylase